MLRCPANSICLQMAQTLSNLGLWTVLLLRAVYEVVTGNVRVMEVYSVQCTMYGKAALLKGTKGGSRQLQLGGEITETVVRSIIKRGKELICILNLTSTSQPPHVLLLQELPHLRDRTRFGG